MAVAEVRGASAPRVDEVAPPSPQSPWRRNLAIGVPAGLIALIVVGCVLLPYVLPIPDPTGGNILESLQGPSAKHYLGTDHNGDDLLARVLHGGRSSLVIGLAVQLLGLVIGGALGALAGYLGRFVDVIIMRLTDVLIAVPSLVLIIVVSQALGPGMRNTILALAFLSIPTFARIARAETLRLREQPFMVAAKLCGTSTWRILARHLAPNIGPAVMTTALLGMGIVIVIEGALTFLGGGVQPPQPTWGNMIFEGQRSLAGTPLLVLWPSIALSLTVLAFTLLGEGLRARWSGGR